MSKIPELNLIADVPAPAAAEYDEEAEYLAKHDEELWAEYYDERVAERAEEAEAAYRE